MNTVRLDEVAPMPWKNGGGTTRELLAWPGASDWKVRLSVAEIEADGPFSSYPGVARWFAVLSGSGVELRVDGLAHTLTAASDPLRFEGSAQVQCRLLSGPTRDFNLMLRGAAGTLQRVRGTLQRQVGAPALIALYAHGESATALFGHEAVTLARGSLTWQILDVPATVRIDATDALWMEIAL